MTAYRRRDPGPAAAVPAQRHPAARPPDNPGRPLVVLRRLPDVVRRGQRMQPFQVERASARGLEVLRPAA